MALVDPSPERVSACPVHFIWDGRGRGRVLVRIGFLGFLIAGAIALCSPMLGLSQLDFPALVVAAASGAAWIAGQVLTLLTVRKLRVSR